MRPGQDKALAVQSAVLRGKNTWGACSKCGKVGKTIRELCRPHYEAGRKDGSLRKIHGVSPADRFWDHVLKRADGCWEWTGYKFPSVGYGAICNGSGKWVMATHVSLLIAGRPVPPGMFACHHCDRPWCVNPEHLFIGTHRDNMADMKRKGRVRKPGQGPRGEACASSKLTEAQVIELRRRRAAGEKRVRLAEEFGINEGTVYNVVRGKTWAHVRAFDRAAGDAVQMALPMEDA